MSAMLGSDKQVQADAVVHAALPPALHAPASLLVPLGHGKQLHRVVEDRWSETAACLHEPAGSFSFVIVHGLPWSFGAIIVEDDSGDSDRILGDFLGG